MNGKTWGRLRRGLAALALTAGCGAQATIVGHGGYLTDSQSGLDWLNILYSPAAFDYNQFVAMEMIMTGEPSNRTVGDTTGWRIARRDEVVTLYNNYMAQHAGETLRERFAGLTGLLGRYRGYESSDYVLYDTSGWVYEPETAAGRSEYGITSIPPHTVTIYYEEALTLTDTTLETGVLAAGLIPSGMTMHCSLYTSLCPYEYESAGLMYLFMVRDTPDTVPEPATLAIVGTGLMGMMLVRRRRGLLPGA